MSPLPTREAPAVTTAPARARRWVDVVGNWQRDWKPVAAGVLLLTLAGLIAVVVQLRSTTLVAAPVPPGVAGASVSHLAFRGAPAGEEITNPGRGLRYEISYDAADMSNPWGQAQPSTLRAAIPELRSQYGAGARIIRIGFYLAPFAGDRSCTPLPGSCTTPLSRRALDNIRTALRDVRAAGYQAILRFAYDIDESHRRCYTVDTIRRHLAQLRPILARFRGVVPVVQAGFVGPWGAWGPSCFGLASHPADVRAILGSLVRALPAGTQTQVPIASLRSAVEGEPIAARVGYYEGYLTLQSGQRDQFAPGLPGGAWEGVLDAAPDALSDGNLPWDGVQASPPLGYAGAIDPIAAIERIQSLHLTTFSAVQGSHVWLRQWRDQPVTPRLLADEGLPVSRSWFRDARGHRVHRSLYDYLRDHLGYRLQLVGGTFGTGQRDRLPVRLTLRNYGFSAPHVPGMVRLVLIDGDDHVVARATTDADWTTWTPAQASESGGDGVPPLHAFSGSLAIGDLPAGSYRLGVVLRGTDGSAPVRLANDGLGRRRGVNVIATVQLGAHGLETISR